MIARLSLLALSLAMIAAAPVVAKDKAAPSAAAETVSCEGVFGPKSSAAAVTEAFGADNVVTGMVDGPEGSEVLATTVYPNDPTRVMEFGWWDEEKREYPSYVELSPSQITPTGVKIGMSVAEVEAINGAPFSINGFWWDYGGNGVFETGALVNPETGCGFWLHFSPKDEYPESLDTSAIAGEVTVPSKEPLLKELDVRVTQITLGYAWPDDLPQPDY